MGSDIRSCTEVRDAGGGWEYVPYFPFSGGRSYAIFGFIGNERNYAHSPVLASYRGVPEDATPDTRSLFEDEDGPTGYHGVNWLSLKEMLNYDYEHVFWDRRVTRRTGLRRAPPVFTGVGRSVGSLRRYDSTGPHPR
jgi:hypothetical protein